MDHDRGDVGEIALPLDHGSGHRLPLASATKNLKRGFRLMRWSA
jgi:hypothetical protein